MKKEAIIWLLPFIVYLLYLLTSYDLSYITQNSHIIKDFSGLLFPFIFALTFYFIYEDYPFTYAFRKKVKK